MTTIQKQITKNYWIEKLNGISTENSNRLERVNLSMDSLLIEKNSLHYFYKLTSDNPIAEFTVLLSILNALLQRYFDECNLIFSNSIPVEQKEQLLYGFVSIEDKTIKQFLQEVKKEVEEVYKHRNYDTSIIEKQSLDNYTPFGFLYNTKDNNVSSAFLVKIDKQENSDLEFSIQFSEEFINPELANHILQRLKIWLQDLETNIERQISQIPILSDKERIKILSEFNATNVDYPYNRTVVDLFEEQVNKVPEDIAVVFEETELSYAALNEKSNQLAYYLRDQYQIQPDDLIGVKLNRSEFVIITILGILKSGAAYVPIDNGYPKERIDYIKKDSKSKVIIDHEELDRFNQTKEKYSKENIEKINEPNNLIYVIYTSGTTGNPKGVMVEHRNVVRLVNPCSFFPLNKDCTLLSTGSISFDATTIEFFGTLLNGARLVLTKQDNLLEVEKLGKVIDNYEVNSLWMTASWFNQVVDNKINIFKNIKQLIVGGDVVSPTHVLKVFEQYPTIKIVNGYGPTENTTFSTTFDIKNQKYNSIPIGKPIPNSFAYILDEQLKVLPIGVSGDLYVSGAGVARGYLNLPDLTLEKFVVNPFKKGEQMYKTGDMARWLPDGNIEFKGRKDTQVKIRGYRIELGEIENAILAFSKNLNQVVVDVKEVNDEKVLVTYYVSSKIINRSDLRIFLEDNLPDYMIPTFYISMEVLPLTTNGKINKKALPNVSQEDIIKKDYVAPRNKTEEKLILIWEEVLGVEEIGITDNFFELGGHSLMVGQVTNRTYKLLGKSFSFKTFFENPTIEGINRELQKNDYSSIAKAQKLESYPLTAAQKRLWVLSQLEGGSIAYNVATAIKITGEIDFSIFKQSFERLINRHEILRTCFRTDLAGEVRQNVLPIEEVNFKIDCVDFSRENNQKICVENYLQNRNNVAFNLESGSLLKASLIKINEEESVFFLSLHHIICDGWSIEVLISEIIKNYNGSIQQKNVELPKLNIQYKDYAIWQITKQQQDEQKLAENYWLKQFEGTLPVLELPSFKTRPLIQTYNGNEIKHNFSNTFLENVKKFSKEQNVTLFMTLMAGVNALIYRYTGQSDIIIGTPIAGREHPDIENQIGLYLNTLAIRTKIKENQSFLNLVKTQKEILLGAYEHQSYPFDELTSKLNLKRDSSRSPLFDIMVVLQNQEQIRSINGKEKFIGLELSEYNYERKTAQFDATFTFVEREELELAIEYNTDIYDAYLIKRMFSHLELLLTDAIEKPEVSIKSLDFLTDAEKNILLKDFNTTKVDFPRDKTVVELFEEQVNKTPDNIAISFGAIQLTYTELDKKSNQFARYLRDNYIVSANDLVGIKLERSEQMIITVLAVLKSGAAYVPIDINYPEERISFIEKDSNSKVVIDTEELNRFAQISKTYSEESLNIQNNQNDLVYVIYTSGTTGTPKGVMVENRSLTNLIYWFTKCFNISESTVSVQLTDLSFDPSVEDIFGTLSKGGTYHVLSKDKLLNIEKLREYIKNHNITILNYVPKFLYELLADSPKISSIETIISGGEKLSEHIKNTILSKGYNLYNNYGPTETTVDALSSKMSDVSVTIGKPVANSMAMVLDNNQKLIPIGCIGELCISGAGLARGYLNHNTLTQQKFVDNPFVEGDRMYFTGDLVRWKPEGTIEYLGRKDTQVKVRGYRIELEEIENTISQYSENMQQIVVAVQEVEQENVLVAYYISEISIDKSELRNFIKEKLPDYMIPAYYQAIDVIPLTSNGKTDRESLPEVSTEFIIKKEYVAPRNSTEDALIEIWKEVLALDKISVTDNFFELGGHSLKLSKLLNLINKKFEVNIAFKELFITTKIEDQAALVLRKNTSKHLEILKVPEAENYVLSSAQRRIWVLSQFEGGNRAYNMSEVFKLEGNLDVDVLEKSFYTLIERHESLRTIFIENDNGDVRQIILPLEENKFQLRFEKLDSEENSIDKVHEIVQKEAKYAFDLSKDSLLRVVLIKITEDTYIFSFVMHHIISDGWSSEVMTNELFVLYNSYIIGGVNPLQPLYIQYKDYAVWQSEQLTAKNIEVHKKYWVQQFKGEIPILNLPVLKTRPAIKTYNGKLATSLYTTSLIEKLNSLCKSQGSTLFMGLLASLKVLLYKYTNQKDIIIGSPIAGRTHADLQGQIGIYVNTLALRTQFEGKDSFNQVLSKIKEVTLGAYEHQQYPFDELVEDLPLKRDMSRNPLFDVMITLQNTDDSNTQELQDVSIKKYNTNDITSKLDIEFIFEETSAGMNMSIIYNTDIFEETFIEQVIIHHKNLLQQIVTSPETSIGLLKFLLEVEENKLLLDFNSTSVDFNKDETILDLFVNQVNISPNKIAIQDNLNAYTYKELNILSDQIASYLVSGYGKDDKSPIAVLLDRSATMIAVLLGVLKSGRSYIPLDPTFPEERLLHIIWDSQVKLVIIDQEEILTNDNDITTINIKNTLTEIRSLESNLSVKVRGENTAYIIYTSGSTGNPKGVEIGHKSLLNFLVSMRQKPGIEAQDKLFSVTTYSFDISILEFFTPLISGATVYIADQDTLSDPELIVQKLQEIKPTIIQATPGFYQVLLHAGWQGDKSLKVLCGGDLLSEKLCGKLIESSSEVWNMYGPTETTIWSSSKKMKSSIDASNIGKPINNTSFYLLDDFLNPVPLGVTGAIFIGGEGLAKGYYKNKSLTQEKFITNSFTGKGLLYETGDIGKWNEKGEIEFLGRNDFQVKVRGYRIELGAIEARLNAISNIKNSVVIAKQKKDQEAFLVAYIIAEKMDVSVKEIIKELKIYLPEYMIPYTIIPIPELPLTPNGKVDRKYLSTITKDQQISSVEYITPRNETEKKLLSIWKTVLDLEKISVLDNFFELGGHSLNATKMVGLIHKEFKIKISINDLFKNMVLEEQAVLLENILIINNDNTDFNKENQVEMESFSL